jgi:hypothetical protein
LSGSGFLSGTRSHCFRTPALCQSLCFFQQHERGYRQRESEVPPPAKADGPSLLFLQQPDGTFTQRTLPMATISGAAWADYDGDGFVDLLSADDSAICD